MKLRLMMNNLNLVPVRALVHRLAHAIAPHARDVERFHVPLDLNRDVIASSSSVASGVIKSAPAMANAASTANGVSAMDKMTTMTKSSSNPIGKSEPVDPEVA